MPRQPRLIAPGLLYHIITRGIEKRDIFKDASDYHFFLDRLGKILNDTGTRCYAFALMPNHIHLLLISGTISISTVMSRLLTGYALYFNKRYKRVGHLFQNRYKSIICEEEPYLLELVRYIHLNPVRAGICKTLTELGGYSYSGHSAILDGKKYNWYEDSDTLTYFGKSRQRALRKYLAFISDGLSMGKNQRFNGGGLKRSLNFPSVFPKEKQAFDERILGSSDYVLNLQALMEKTPKKLSNSSISDIIEATSRLFNLNPDEIRGRRQTTSLIKARTMIAVKAVTDLGLSFAETSRHLNVHRSTVARLVERARELETGDEG